MGIYDYGRQTPVQQAQAELAAATNLLIAVLHQQLVDGWRAMWRPANGTSPEAMWEAIGTRGKETGDTNVALSALLTRMITTALEDGADPAALPRPFADGSYALGVPDGTEKYRAVGVGRVYALDADSDDPTGNTYVCTDITPPPPEEEAPPEEQPTESEE